MCIVYGRTSFKLLLDLLSLCFLIPIRVDRPCISTCKGNQHKTADTGTTCVRTMRAAIPEALQKMKEWSGVLIFSTIMYVVRTRAGLETVTKNCTNKMSGEIHQ